MSHDRYMEIGTEGRWQPTLAYFLDQIFNARIDSKAESEGVGDHAVNIYMAGILRDMVDGARTARFNSAYVRETDLRLHLEAHPPQSDRELSDLYRHNGDFWWLGGELTERIDRRQGARGTWWQVLPVPREARQERMASFYDQALTFHRRARRGTRSGISEALDYVLRHPARHVELMDRVVARLLPVLVEAGSTEGLLGFSGLSTEFLSCFLADQISDLHDAQAAGQPTAPLELTIREIRAALSTRFTNHPRSITGDNPPPS